MRISWIKNQSDKKSFRLIQNFGAAVYELTDPEEIDKTIENLRKEEEYNTFIISNELAGFSENIIKKYKSDENISIIIAPNKTKL